MSAAPQIPGQFKINSLDPDFYEPCEETVFNTLQNFCLTGGTWMVRHSNPVDSSNIMWTGKCLDPRDFFLEMQDNIHISGNF